MLFNLTSKRHFPSKQNESGILFSKDKGPCFGDGANYELIAWYQPLNGDKNCLSWANKSGFSIPLEEKINILTNKLDGKFTI
jgi:hypothetical protein